MTGTRSSRGARAVPVLVAVVTVVAFLPALHAGFVTWDDDRNFLDNPAWRGLGGSQLEWMWTTFHMGHYVPAHVDDARAGLRARGMNPAGYHLHSVVLHAINAVLVYALALKLLRLARRGGEELDRNSLLFPAAVGALLFSVHPLRVESVAWITERRDVLSMLFMLISTLSYITHVERGRGFTRWYALAIASFVCALLSKATAMSLPAALLVLNVYPLRRVGGHAGFTSDSARRVYVELVPFGLLAAAIAALSVVALDPPEQLSLGAKVAVSAYSLAFYVVKTIAPANLAPLYEMPRQLDPVALRYVFSYLAVAGLTSVAWIVRRRYPGVTAAWFGFLVIVLPMLGIVQNGPQIAADRYTYHAAPALAILAGGALVGWRRRSPLVPALIASVSIACLGVLTWRQTGIWQDSERLWSRVLAVDPNVIGRGDRDGRSDDCAGPRR